MLLVKDTELCKLVLQVESAGAGAAKAEGVM